MMISILMVLRQVTLVKNFSRSLFSYYSRYEAAIKLLYIVIYFTTANDQEVGTFELAPLAGYVIQIGAYQQLSQ